MRSITLSSLCTLKQSLLLSWKTGWCNRSMNIFWLVDDQTSDCCGEKSGPVNEIISGLIQTDSHTEREGNKLQASASVLPPSKPVITPACNHTGTVKPAAHTHTRTYSDSNDPLCHTGAIVGLITNLINLCLFNVSCRIGGLKQPTARRRGGPHRPRALRAGWLWWIRCCWLKSQLLHPPLQGLQKSHTDRLVVVQVCCSPVLSFILTMHQPVDFATPAIVDVSQMVFICFQFKDVLYRELLWPHVLCSQHNLSNQLRPFIYLLMYFGIKKELPTLELSNYFWSR